MLDAFGSFLFGHAFAPLGSPQAGPSSPPEPVPVHDDGAAAVLPPCGLRASVVGCGRMGCVMAGELARRGCEVTLYDSTDFSRRRAMQTMRAFLYEHVERGYLSTADVEEVVSRCTLVENLIDAVGTQMIIEAVPEDLDIKRRLLKQIAETYKQLSPPPLPPPLLCSNTISLRISDLAEGLPPPLRARVIGVRFLHPVWFVDEVEVSPNSASGSGAAGEVTALLCRMSLTAHHYDGHRPRRLNDEQAQAYARRQQGRARSGAATPRAPIAAAAAAENGSGQGEQCSICLDAPRDTLTVPCGHVASCEACLKRLLELQGPHRALCVVCRKPIERLVRAPPAASTREQHE